MKGLLISLAAIGLSVTACSAPHGEDARQKVEANDAVRDVAKEEANRKVVLKMFSAKNVEEITQDMADDYKQHNPGIADGKKGAQAFFADLFKRFPQQKAKVIHVAADGDYVWVHAHLTMSPKDPGMALVDIWRLKDGKMVEHWDIMQPVPAKTTSGNPMF